jgi:endonuclease-3 related protein
MIKNLIKIIENNRELLRKNHWIVTDANSFKWWDNFEDPEKIVVSAILVQQTRWEIARKVTERLFNKIKKLSEISSMSKTELEETIKGVNFYRRKAVILKDFVRILADYSSLLSLLNISNKKILLSIKGLGEETVDSILLFAGNQLTFPISQYSIRILSRIFDVNFNKKELRKFLTQNLEYNLYYYKLLHAGLVSVGRTFCKVKPKCKSCIFKELCIYNNRRDNNEAI